MKRLPIIRHIRYWLTIRAINKHYEIYRSIGMLPVYADHDYEIANMIWRGEL